MPQPPAFQFYPADWLTGTLTFSLAEEGAYLRCVNHQWLSGGVPDALDELAGVMRVPKSRARTLWAVVGKKFQRGDDGLWRNARVEAERAKQAAYREAQAANGRASGAARRQRTTNGGSTAVQPTLEPNTQPNRTLQSSSSSTPSVKNTEGDARGPAPRKGYGDPFHQRIDRNAAALIIPREGQVIAVPSPWAERVKREYGTTDARIDEFATWAGPVVAKEGVHDGGKRFAWLDGLWARFNEPRDVPASQLSIRAYHDEIAEKYPKLAPERVSQLLREGAAAARGKVS